MSSSLNDPVKPRKLRFGVLGMSEGNGHPYSWSAICNGYDEQAMLGCPYPLILDYLSKQTWPEARLGLAEVTHVWTQERAMSESIRSASKVPTIVDEPKQMIGLVDGILLARDDADCHLELAAPFLEAGLPVFIDKPLALSVAEAERIYRLSAYPGQIFTGSSLRFSSAIPSGPSLLDTVGEIKVIRAVTPRVWRSYAPHVVDPVLHVLGYPALDDAAIKVVRTGTTTSVQVGWPKGPLAELTALGLDTAFYPFTMEFFGSKGYLKMEMTDYFTAFKESLRVFAQSILDRSEGITKVQALCAVQLYEAGLNG